MKSCYWLRGSSWGNECSHFAKILSFKENKIVCKHVIQNGDGLVHVITTLTVCTGIKFCTGIIEDQILEDTSMGCCFFFFFFKLDDII